MLFGEQKLFLEQNLFKNQDRIETLENQKVELKRELEEVNELMMGMTDNSQSITSIDPKSRQQSIDENIVGIKDTSRNVDSELKGGDTADFGQNVKKEDSVEKPVTSVPKIQTLRSKRDETFQTRLVDDSKQEPIKQEDGPTSVGRQKSTTSRRDPEYKTDDRFTSQSNQEYGDEQSNFARTNSKLSRMSGNKILTSKKSQKFMRGKNKMSIKEELQLLQDIKEHEKDKEALVQKNQALLDQIDELNKEAIKWKLIMSSKIAELEDKISRMKTAQANEKNQIKEEYAKDFIRVTKLSKKREQTLIQNIKTEIEFECTNKINELKQSYEKRISDLNLKLSDLQSEYDQVCHKEKSLRSELNRLMHNIEKEEHDRN